VCSGGGSFCQAGVHMLSQARACMELFAGYAGAYGIYRVDETKRRPGRKLEGQAVTVRKPVTEELWHAHLVGEAPLGVITIRESNDCKWGAVDIDRYNIDHAALVQRITQANLPFIVARTKSGGAHLLVFFNEPVPAWIVQSKLSELAASLGFGDCEIFPKQTELDTDREDLGSWLNMPYFDAQRTTRYAFDADGNALSIEDSVRAARAARIDHSTFETLEAAANEKVEDFDDGPFCLQAITLAGGIAPGQRNSTLVNMGVYAKKKWPEDWKAQLERMNQTYNRPPLPVEEVLQVTKHLAKKEYFFACKKEPLKSHCNSAVCKARPYGVGGDGPSISITELRKLDTDPPLWFIDVPDTGTVELTTDQLNSPTLFTKACMEQQNFRPVLTNKAWNSALREAFDRLIVIEMDESEKREGSVVGAFDAALDEFLSRPKGDEIEEVLLRKAVIERERLLFRLNDLIAYLERKGFREWTRAKITNTLRERGGRSERPRKIQGRTARLWSLPRMAEDGD